MKVDLPNPNVSESTEAAAQRLRGGGEAGRDQEGEEEKASAGRGEVHEEAQGDEEEHEAESAAGIAREQRESDKGR